MCDAKSCVISIRKVLIGRTTGIIMFVNKRIFLRSNDNDAEILFINKNPKEKWQYVFILQNVSCETIGF